MSTIIGSAEVQVKGNLKPLEQSLTQAKQKTEEANRAMDRGFETSRNRASRLTDAVTRAERAVAELTRASNRMADAAEKMGNATGRAARQTDQLDASSKRAAAAGTFLGTAMTRAGLAIAAGLVVATVSAVKAMNEAEEAQRRLANVMSATGNTSGQSMERLADDARDLSVATGESEVKIKAAMAAVAGFGEISGQTFRDVIARAADLADTLGTDLVKSAVDVAKALEEPAKAADIFANINFSAATARNAQALKDMGDTAGATAMIMGELAQRVGGKGASKGDSLSDALDQAWNSWKRFSSESSIGAWIKDVDISALSSIAGFFNSLGKEIDGVDTDRLTEIVSELSKLPSGSGGTFGHAGRRAASLRQEYAAGQAPRIARRAADLAASGQGLGSRLETTFTEAEPKIVDTSERATKAMTAYGDAIKRAQAAAEQLAETIASSNAETAQIKNLGQQYLDGRLSLEQYNEQMQIATALRQANVSAESQAGQTLAANISVQTAMTAAIKDKTAADREAAQVAERVAEARASLLTDTQEEIVQLEAETRALGMTDQQATVYLKTQELIARAKQDGVEVTADLISAIEKEAQAYGAAKTKLDAMTEAQEAAKKAAEDAYQAQKQQFDYLNQTLSGGLIDVLTGEKSAKEALKDIGNELNRSVLEAAIGGFGPMADLFGGASSGGLFGSIFGVPTKNGALPVWVEGSNVMPGTGQVQQGGGGGLLKILGGLAMKIGGTYLGGTDYGFGPGMGSSLDLSGLPVNNDFSNMLSADLASFHTGLYPGAPSPAMRSVPLASVVAAPKFHTGLQSDEFVGILQRGEEVIPKGQAGRRGSNITVNINGVADFDSFKRNESQVRSMIGAATARDIGRNG